MFYEKKSNGRLIVRDEADSSNLADRGAGSTGVVVAEVNIVQRSVRPFSQSDNVAIGSVRCAVRRFEVKDAGNVPGSSGNVANGNQGFSIRDPG